MKISWVPEKKIDWEEVKAEMEASEKSNHFANFGPAWRKLSEEAGKILGLAPDRRVVPVANGALALESLAAALCHQHQKLFRFAVQSSTFACCAQGLLRGSLILDIAPWGSREGVGPALAELEEKADEFDCLVVTNLCGSCTEISGYVDFCARRGKFLLFDNAATPMSWYQGRNVNDYGLGCAVSLHHTKPLGFGEGGLAIVEEGYFQSLLEVINFGYNSENRVKFSPYGTNAKMSDVAAVYCLQWLRRAPEILERHSAVEELFRREISAVGEETGCALEFLPDRGEGGKKKLSSSCVIFFPLERQWDLQFFLSRGLECKKYYYPLSPTPEAANFYRRVLCFPLHIGMGKEEVEFIGRALREALARPVESLPLE